MLPTTILVFLVGIGQIAVLAAPVPYGALWSEEVQPILDRHCFKCHAGVKQKSGLDLRSLETMLRGGENGPALIPNDPAKSHMIQYLQPGSDPHMPPDEKKQLKPHEIEVLRKWVSSLPRPKGPISSNSSTNTAWVEEYLIALRATHKPVWIPPKHASPSEVIDGFLARSWREKKIKPAAVAADNVFVRRVYLDLAGRIPTPEETQMFLADAKAGKRERVVNTLLGSKDYPRHMREVFDVILMGRPVKRNESLRRENGWYDFLEKSFQNNRPWNEMVREMIVARGTNEPNRGAVWFLYERQNNHQAMAEAVAPIAFGVNMKCAQCHNHPLAWEIEQRHYWGLVAALNRSKGVQTASGPAMTESAIGGFVSFANLKKESQPALLAFLNGKTVAEKRPDADAKEEDKADLYVVPPAKGDKPSATVPKFSRREALADAVIEDNPVLALAFVNRIWGLLMGCGLVQPVDQMDSRHTSSHPDLLEWLARDFEKHGCDVKRLIKTIVLSRAYQLESKPGRGRHPRPETFSCGLEKPLSAEQLLRSTLIATRETGQEAADLKKLLITLFPEVMPVNYSPSLQQALFLSNSPLVNELIQPKNQNAASQLLAQDSVETRIETAFRWVLGRSPDAEERARFRAFLSSKSAEHGVRDLLWALLNTAEFQLNH